jgi:hypothetical protein
MQIPANNLGFFSTFTENFRKERKRELIQGMKELETGEKGNLRRINLLRAGQEMSGTKVKRLLWVKPKTSC